MFISFWRGRGRRRGGGREGGKIYKQALRGKSRKQRFAIRGQTNVSEGELPPLNCEMD